jgi:peptidyl-tRNA hydrolase, PTH1 family
MPGIRLVAGLGNPGGKYASSRHNAGFRWADLLAEDSHASFQHETRFSSDVCRIPGLAGDIWLIKPQTFMNASGRAVSAMARYYRIAPEEVLVVHDELDLPPGVVRIKQGGGLGGHNGLKDIQSALGDPLFWRLRLGIGHPGDRSLVTDYVLHEPGRADAEAIESAMRRGLGIFPLLAAGKPEAAMLRLHTQDRQAATDPGKERA